QHVALLEPADRLGKLGARNLLLEHLSAAGGPQLCILSGQVLIAGRNPGISVERHVYSPKSAALSARHKPPRNPRPSAAVATSREGQRSPRSGRAIPHRRWERARILLPDQTW